MGADAAQFTALEGKPALSLIPLELPNYLFAGEMYVRYRTLAQG